MQLRLAFSVPKFTGSGFNQTTSAILTGVTIAGAFSTVIFNSTTAKDKLGDSFKTFASLLANTPLYEGIKKVAGTFKDWGTTIVAKKDDFVQWVNDYLNLSGLKSGAAALYEKLYAWAEIVYDWFKNKFLIFISRIPDMVQNWKKLRLSLFKWGTFLGGGGGSALWAMFGNGDNWGKLAELMGNPAYEGLLDKFANLVQENSSAFENMSPEDAQEMLEGILEDPKEAEKMLDELAEERKEKNEKKEAELKKENKEKEKDVELETEEILSKLGKPKGGKPKDNTQALGNLIASGFKGLDNSTSFNDAIEKAKANMEEHIKLLENESKRSGKSAEVKKQFLADIKESKDDLIKAFAKLSATALDLNKGDSKINQKIDEKKLASTFEYLLKKQYTERAKPGEEGNAEGLDGIVVGSVGK